MRPSSSNSRLSSFDEVAREAAAIICIELNAKELAKLGERRTWFDLQGGAVSLAISEQTLSRYVKEKAATASVKIGNGRRFHRNDLDTWIRAGGILAFKKAEGDPPTDVSTWLEQNRRNTSPDSASLLPVQKSSKKSKGLCHD
jgi:hypothetical protein